MQKKTMAAALAAVFTIGVTSARAEPWVDWSPGKEAVEKMWINVDPIHLDDYLTGLRKTWRTSQDIRKKHGVIEDYHVLTKDDMSGDGPNVLLVVVYPSMAMMDPDRDRALSVAKEYNAVVSKEETAAMVKNYDEWRKPTGENIWHTVHYSK